MAVVEIITYGNPILRKKAEEVVEINDEIKSLIQDLQDTLAAAPGVGIAAPQIGVSKRVIVVDLTNSKEKMPKKLTMINPKIVFKSPEVSRQEEGCLSVPKVWGEVTRAESIKVKGQLPSGRIVTIEAEGFFARAIQHEMEHLDGHLFIDHLNPRDLSENKLLIDEIFAGNKKKLESVVQ